MDGRKGNTIVTSITFMVCFAMMLMTAGISEAVELEMKWEKTFDDYIFVDFAKESGDVLIDFMDAKKADIMLLDNKGNIISVWGPRVDRYAFLPTISHDGKVFAFSSTPTRKAKLKKKQDDEVIHYMKRNGQEVWSRKVYSSLDLDYRISGTYRPHVSPDGNFVAYVGYSGIEGGGNDIELISSSGKTLWKYEIDGFEEFLFSPDSKFLIAGLGGGNIIVLNLSGGEVYKDTSFLPTLTTYTTSSIDSNFIGTTGHVRTAIISKDGEVILKNTDSRGYAFVSKEGNKAVLWDKQLDVYDISSKEKIATFAVSIEPENYHPKKFDISGDGKIVTVTGIKPGSLTASVFIINTVDKSLFEMPIKNPDGTQIAITNDGTGFLLVEHFEDPDKSSVKFYKVKG